MSKMLGRRFPVDFAGAVAAVADAQITLRLRVESPAAFRKSRRVGAHGRFRSFRAIINPSTQSMLLHLLSSLLFLHRRALHVNLIIRSSCIQRKGQEDSRQMVHSRNERLCLAPPSGGQLVNVKIRRWL